MADAKIMVIRGIILGEIQDLAGLQDTSELQVDRLAMMVGPVVDGGESSRAGRHADIFPATGLVRSGHLIFGENRLIRALRDTGAAIDAGVRIDIKPGPLPLRFPGDNTLDRTYIDAAPITEAQASDDIGHCFPPN
jgi:hypothetical protein